MRCSVGDRLSTRDKINSRCCKTSSASKSPCRQNSLPKPRLFLPNSWREIPKSDWVTSTREWLLPSMMPTRSESTPSSRASTGRPSKRGPTKPSSSPRSAPRTTPAASMSYSRRRVWKRPSSTHRSSMKSTSRASVTTKIKSSTRALIADVKFRK